jgi:catechol 2,3-dioxygenase-like lactoylglutathione lyase family enzyme
MNDQTPAARIVHVALFTRNPRDLAPFYRDAFNMKIVHVGGAVQLWDGHVLLALNPWRGVDPETLRIDEVGEGIYRIATFDPSFGISFNQFLIADAAPALIHTGPHFAYERVRDMV